MKVPYTPGCFTPESPADNLAQRMASHARQSIEEIKKSKNTILLAAFARRTGLKGTAKQVLDHQHRFKRIISPESELVLLDGMPLVEFKNPEFVRTDGEHQVVTYDIKFQYKDFTVL